MPTFSIIIPAYNSENSIKRCIMSVQNQTYKDFEIIVVNDGSSDSTKEVLDELSMQDSKIKVIHQTNQGPLLARQNGINVATGQYILFLDSDDYYDLNLLETIGIYCENGYDIILFRFRSRFGNNSCIDSNKIFDHETIITNENKNIIYKKLISSRDLNSLSIKAVKKTLFNISMFKNNKYNGIKNGEDLMYTIPLFNDAKSIIYLDIPLYNYIRNTDGTTQNFSESFYESRKLIVNLLSEYLTIWGMDTKENHDVVNKRFFLDIVNGIPKSCQVKKIGKYLACKYLSNIATDDMFRKKFTVANMKGMNIISRIQLHLIFRKEFSLVLFIEKLRSIGNLVMQTLLVKRIR
jgi:glycosyltransferase involved in cell wall biosynthesis